MLTIYNNQLLELADKNREGFVLKMIKLLRSDIEEVKELNDSDLKVQVEQQILKANKYGLNRNTSVAIYLISAFLMGENFDEDFEAAAEILQSKMTQEEMGDKLEKWVYEIFRVL